MIGRLLRRAIDLRRYENTVALRVVSLLQDARDDIVRQLAAVDPTQGARERRLRALLRQTDDILAQAYQRAHRGSRADLRALGPVMGRAAQGDLGLEAVAVGQARLQAIVDTEMVRGWPMAKWWASQERATADEFERQMRLGLSQSETIDQLMRRVRGSSIGGGRYAGGLMETSTRQATTLVRTAANQVANRAAQLTQEANKDVAPKYRYLATLDARTTPICQALDGQEFRVDDDKAPRPPQHWNCRSTTVGVVDWQALGLTPPTRTTRASKDGPVSADLTYVGWLKQQSAAEQDDILGPSRGRLFRAGKVTLRDMVTREGRTLTLAELETRTR